MTKPCANCGQPIIVNKRESIKRRKYCGLPCSQAATRAITPNPVTTRYKTVKLPTGRCRGAHRVAMERDLGRTLETWEHVHHRDGNKLNNELSNLEVVSASDHARLHMIGNRHAKK